jgi:integrase/recombinase XerD
VTPKPHLVTPTPPTALRVLVDDYLANCRMRGLSLKTIRDRYEWALVSIFLPWCADQGIERPDQLTSRLLTRFAGHLQQYGGRRGQLSPHTVDTYVSTVNYFLAWARKEGEAIDERAKAPTPKLPRAMLEVLTPGEIQKMTDAATNDRDRLILQILWETGCRGSELLGLRLGDVDERERRYVLRVKGPSFGGGAKGDRSREVPIPRAFRNLRRYIARGRPADVQTDIIFLGRRRDYRTGTFEPLTLSGLEQLIRNLAREAGIERRIWLHLVRHSAITHMLQQGMNPLLVAKLVGHSSLEMINRVYSHLDNRDLYEALLKLSAD